MKRTVETRWRKDRERWGVDYVDASGRRHRPLFESEDKALAHAVEVKRKLDAGIISADPNVTLAAAFERYFITKSRKKSLDEDRRVAEHLKAEFGESTKLRALTAARIAAYRDRRLAATVRGKDNTAKKLSAAAVNRPLALLRHLLRLAHEEWGLIPSVPRIRLEKEPQGRVRWLGQYAPDEEQRLLAACAESKRNPELLTKVVIALESGLRKGELESLDWQDNIDMARGVFMLEVTKSGRRREVPMRQVVYDLLAALPEPHVGPVWKNGDVGTSFQNAVERVGIKDFPFHAPGTTSRPGS